MSLALDTCLHAPAALRAFDAEALAQAMLDYEAALARALADAGQTGATEALAIASVCQAALYDLPVWLADARRAGHPAIPLVHELRQTVRLYRREAADAVHRGATDDELLDTAVALCTARALDHVFGLLQHWLDDGAAASLDDERAHRAAVSRGLERLATLRPLALTARWGQGLPSSSGTLPSDWTSVVAERLAGQLGLATTPDERLATEHADRLLLEAALLARELGRRPSTPGADATRGAATQALEHAARHLAAPPHGPARHEAWCRTFVALITAAHAAAEDRPPPFSTTAPSAARSAPEGTRRRR